MMTFRMTALLATSCLMGLSTPALAQDRHATHAQQIEMLQKQVEALSAQIEAMKADLATPAQPAPETTAKIEALEAQVADLEKTKPATEIKFKAAPEMKAKGWSFKPRGRLMYDFADVSAPSAIVDDGLGFSNELRRGRLGVQGDIPGNLGYKFEIDFAGGDADITDAYISYETGDVELTVGQHNNFQSLDELTSSLHESFIERAAFTDAFGFSRRVGVSAQYGAGDILLQAGVFTDNIADLGDDENNSRSFDVRGVFMPKLGDSQLHLGGSFHYRDLGDAISSVRYRQRPAVHSTDTRFINTGNIANAESETGYGVEAAAIIGSLDLSAEGFWQKVGRTAGAEPTFFGAYAAAGYWLTGETRGYKGGSFDRVKVKNGFADGGMGAFGVNLRYDYLDLNDAGIIGGTQKGIQGSLLWKPSDYILFGLNYARLNYEDAAIPAGADTDYGVDMIALRAQVDF